MEGGSPTQFAQKPTAPEDENRSINFADVLLLRISLCNRFNIA